MIEQAYITKPDIISGKAPKQLIRFKTLCAVALGMTLFIISLGIIWEHLHLVSYKVIIEKFEGLSWLYIAIALLLTLISFSVATFEDALSAPKETESPFAKRFLSAFIANSVTNITDMGTLGGPSLRNRLFTIWSLSSIDLARLGMLSQRSIVTSGSLVFILAALAGQKDINIALGIPSIYVYLVSAVLVLLTIVYGLYSRPLVEENAQSLPAAFVPYIFGVIKWLTAAGAFYVCFQGGFEFSFPLLLTVFILSHSLGRLSGLPGGFGVFEAACFLLLPVSEPASLIVALIAYRCLYFFAPLMLSAILISFTKTHPLNKRIIGSGAKVIDVFETIAPPLYAVLIFFTGSIMLVSAATPDRAEKMPFLSEPVGLFVTEVSHLLASMMACLLLIVAIGLRKRLKNAWAISVASLFTGALFTLLKGADPKGALVLMTLALCLFASKDAFYRKGFVRNIPLSWPRLALITGTIGFAIWVGFYAYLDEPYSASLWWQFGTEGNVSRFFRSFVLIGILLMFYGFWRLLQPAPSVKFGLMNAATSDKVEAILKAAQIPGSESNLAYIGDKQFLFSKSGSSFIMYGVKGRNWVAMGNPVGLQSEREELIWAFRKLADQWDAWPCFYAVRTEDINDYIDAGFALQKIGELAIISLADFTMEGKKRSELRNSKSRALREGCEFEVIYPAIHSAEMDALEKVSLSWLSHHQGKEKQFSLGRFDREVLTRQPIAIIRRQGAIIAFANLWTTSDKSEISVDLMRYENVKINGLMDYLFTEVILWAKAEGYGQFSLGMAPLSGLAGDKLAPFMTKLGALIFEHGGKFYGFKGLRAFKQKFMPDWQPVYLAAPSQLTMPVALGNLALLSSGGFLGLIQK